MFTPASGLVETSNNVASIHPIASSSASSVSYLLVTSTRSSLGPALEAVRDSIEAVAHAFGAQRVVRTVAYPGWAPNTHSPVLKVCGLPQGVGGGRCTRASSGVEEVGGGGWSRGWGLQGEG